MQLRGLLFYAGTTLVAGCLSNPAGVDSDPATTADEQELGTPSVYRWTDDVQIGGSMTSPYQVGLASHANGLSMVYTGNNTMLYTSHFTGSGWSTVHGLPSQSADYGPALADFGGKLTTVYHAHGQNRLLMSTSTDGNTWSTPVTAGTPLFSTTLKYAPALAVRQGVLYAAYCEAVAGAGRDRVELDRFDGTSWTLAHTVDLPVDTSTNTQECKHVALATLPDGRLELVFTENDTDTGNLDDWPVHEVIGSGTNLSVWVETLSPMKSAKPPSITTCNGDTHLVHGGFSNPLEIWWTVLNPTTKTWYANVVVPDQASEGGAALGCYQGTRPIMVHDGGDAILWWSEYQ